MVQVSFPGVYVREVPSGVRTITGVATSIAVFIGMARRGPINTPTRVLGFVDYDRAFSSDTSLGEMTDQVRQFFQNGGQQAFIVRVAATPGFSSVNLLGQGGTTAGPAVLTLTAASPGSDGAQLRASVDYKTASPESTFNLRVFREVVDASGNATITDDETHKDLSMNPADPRFVQNVLLNNSALVTGTVVAAAASAGGASIGATLSGNVLNTVNAAIAASKTQFRVRVGTRDVVTVTLATALGALTDIDAAIQAQYSLGAPITATSTVGSGSLQSLKIAATTVGEDVTIQSATSAASDITKGLGLGVAQGGVEISAHADRRPRPTGYVSVVGANLANLLTFAGLSRDNLTGLTLNPPIPNGWTVTKAQIPFSVPTGNVSTGTTAGDSLLNVRETLSAIAAGINGVQSKWRAEVQGYRLALLPRFGTSSSGTAFTLTGTGTGWVDISNAASTDIFDTDNTVARRAGEALTGGDDGSPPKAQEYTDAFIAIDKNVDLFNILVLPRTTADADFRANVWGDASTFCLQRRAFLVMDASTAATSVEKVLTEITALRIGLVKDHAALYWPPVLIPDGTGLTKAIDPSGSIAGIMARIDATRGVWKAPAGLEADVRGIRGVAINMSDPENGLLNPEAINAVRSFPNGIVSWGARTMDGFDNSGDDDFKYVPVRRFELFLEESLVRGLKFAVFEPNDEPLWAQIRIAAGAFLNNLFRAGAFAGKTPRDAYFVKVDNETTTQNDINLGIVNVLVGFAPLKPAEFVIITVRQQAGQVQV